MTRLLVAAPLALLVVGTAAHAQTTTADTLPFHRGQWGVEGGVGNNGGNVGALRFVSPATALTLNLFAGYNSYETEQEGGSGSNGYSSSGSSVGASLGLRRYVPAGRAIAGIFGAGVTGSHGQSHSEGSASKSSGRNYAVGGYAEAGASYFVTPRLSLSGLYGLSAQYSRSRNSSENRIENGQVFVTPTTTQHGWSIQTSGVRLNAAIFF